MIHLQFRVKGDESTVGNVRMKGLAELKLVRLSKRIIHMWMNRLLHRGKTNYVSGTDTKTVYRMG